MKKINRPQRISDIKMGGVLQVNGPWTPIAFNLAIPSPDPRTARGVYFLIPNGNLITVVSHEKNSCNGNYWVCKSDGVLIRIDRHDFPHLTISA